MKIISKEEKISNLKLRCSFNKRSIYHKFSKVFNALRPTFCILSFSNSSAYQLHLKIYYGLYNKKNLSFFVKLLTLNPGDMKFGETFRGHLKLRFNSNI